MKSEQAVSHVAPFAADAAAADSLHDLRHTAGLDVAAGLRRTRGQQALYITLLRRFADLERDFCTRLDTMLAAGQWRDAGRQLHSLRGALAMLGASDLGEMAATLEQAIHAQEDDCPKDALRADLSRRMQSLLDAIDRLPR